MQHFTSKHCCWRFWLIIWALNQSYLYTATPFQQWYSSVGCSILTFSKVARKSQCYFVPGYLSCPSWSAPCILPFHTILRTYLKLSLIDNLMSLRRMGAVVYIATKESWHIVTFILRKDCCIFIFSRRDNICIHSIVIHILQIKTDSLLPINVNILIWFSLKRFSS